MRRSSGRIGLVVVAAAAIYGLLSVSAYATTAAGFMDRVLFKPHHSPITGAMVVNNATWYGIDILPQLVILCEETSLGDPRLGGELARRNNFGCLRAGSTLTKWGMLANGRVTVAGVDWFTFPDAQTGMMAWGRFLKLARNGAIKAALCADPCDWEAFAEAYNGDAASLQDYITSLQQLEESLRAKAAKYEVSLDSPGPGSTAPDLTTTSTTTSTTTPTADVTF